MNKKVICLWKPKGVTPFELVEKIKKSDRYKNTKIGYAGRLDPMAEGIMLFLVDDENKKRKEYERLPKTYCFDVLFGISSDSYDALGRICLHPPKAIEQNKLKIKTGKFIQQYPPYSYVKVSGRPLFWWARNNKLDGIKIPEKTVEIYSSKLIEFKNRNMSDIANEVIYIIKNISGDYRQKEVVDLWLKAKSALARRYFDIATYEISCSRGTYVRSIARDLGEKIGSGAIALSITRTGVGSYSKLDCETWV